MSFVKIKASGINNLSDARYFSVFCEWIGFNFSPQKPLSIGIGEARELSSWLSGVRLVGEFDDLSFSEMQPYIQGLSLDIVETSLPDFPTQDLPIQVSSLMRRINFLPDDDWNILNKQVEREANKVAYFVATCATSWDTLPDTAQKWLRELCSRHRVIVSLPFSANTVLGLVEQLQPAGIELKGGIELRSGFRLFDDVQAIVDVLI